MKAIQVSEFGGPEVLKLKDAPDPIPQPGQVLISVRAVGVNPVDTYIRAGKYGPRPMPFIPGADAAGVVDAIGSGVATCRVGDNVYVWNLAGSYAQKIVVDQSRVYPLPTKVSFAQGACLGVPAATAYCALFQRGEAKAGQSVLVHGATGGVGTSAVQLARAAGLLVIGSGGTEEGRKLIRQLGCHHAVDHRSPDYMKEVMDLTGGRGVDLILEMLANVNLQRDLEALAKFGKVVVIGSRGTIEMDPRLTMGKDLDIRGMVLFNCSDAELRSIHAGLYAAMDSGAFSPVVGKQFPLAEAAAAHKEVMENHAPGNIVLLP